jgi:cytochrome bd-type quinol oxidase subunit 2
VSIMLIAGLGLIVLSLNLFVVWRTLRGTLELRDGILLVLVGLIIAAVSVGMWISKHTPQEWNAMANLAATTAAIGATALLSNWGRNHQQGVWNIATILLMFGFLIFFAGLFMPCILLARNG